MSAGLLSRFVRLTLTITNVPFAVAVSKASGSLIESVVRMPPKLAIIDLVLSSPFWLTTVKRLPSVVHFPVGVEGSIGTIPFVSHACGFGGGVVSVLDATDSVSVDSVLIEATLLSDFEP